MTHITTSITMDTTWITAATTMLALQVIMSMEAMIMANSTMSITMRMMWVAAATAITLALRMITDTEALMARITMSTTMSSMGATERCQEGSAYHVGRSFSPSLSTWRSISWIFPLATSAT